MQRASLLSRSDRILVYPGRRTASGLWLSVEPYLVLPYGSAPEEIGSAVLRALSLSHGIEPDPSGSRSVIRAWLQQQSSLRQRFRKAASLC